MLLKGLLLVIDDVAVLNFCRQSEERIMAEVRFYAHVLVVESGECKLSLQALTQFSLHPLTPPMEIKRITSPHSPNRLLYNLCSIIHLYDKLIQLILILLP